MARLFPALVTTLLITQATIAAEFKNGFYVLENEGKGEVVERVGGGKLPVGQFVANHFGEAKIWSVNNQNSKFYIMFSHAGPIPPEADQKRLMMIIDGLAEPVSSTRRVAGGFVEMMVMIESREAAEKMAKIFNVEIQRRKHPGHKIVGEFRPTKETWNPGETVTLEMTLHNVGEVPFTFENGGKQRGYRNNQFRFIAWPVGNRKQPLPDVGSRDDHGGISNPVTIAPGASFKSTVELTRWFAFQEPQTYEITCLFEVPIYGSPDEFGRVGHPLWNDFIVGECNIHIEAAGKQQ